MFKTIGRIRNADEKIFDIEKELWVTAITSFDQLKTVLENWYEIIEGTIDLTGKWLTSSIMSELTKYSYLVEWYFLCNNNLLTSFEWFPSSCGALSCYWNNITSVIWLPEVYVDYTLDNKFFKLEELVEWKLYKYGDDFFLLNDEYFTDEKFKSGIELIKWFDTILNKTKTLRLNNINWVNFKRYGNILWSKLYPYYVHVVRNVVQFNGKLYLKDILDPQFYKNWWNIDSLEIKNIWEDVIEINWKKFKKKLSKSLK